MRITITEYQHHIQWGRISARFAGTARDRARSGLVKAGSHLSDAIHQHIGWTDHSLKDLARMGHPYGRGPRSDGRSRAAIPHGPFDVHIQRNVRRGPASPNITSLLSEAIFLELTASKGNMERVNVGVDTTKAPHAIYVLDGTRTMIQRDFLRGSFNEVKDQLAAAFDEGFGRD